jgi:hypothetical protein
MPQFQLNTPITTTDPTIEVTSDPNNPLPPGVYRFQLVVIDDSENASEPAFVEVLVRDSQKPTAVIDAPDRVEFGQPFKLSGERSADLPPGKIKQYVWTMVPDPNRPPIPPIIRPPIDRIPNPTDRIVSPRPDVQPPNTPPS